uniref:Integrase catalytic domain-containing protein n=1 Tax=Tanacetum cinerariifolium TaxID=118510 RepID=A0A6L2KJ07_TANCI|nr:hypothetical protein [Tanacetum cinerariifolium]
MFFYLTTLGRVWFLKETIPQVEPPVEGQSSNAQAVQAVEAWKHSDFLCHNYVPNGLIDHLYNVYYKTTTAKELWESLECKYKTEDAGTKKFVVARFLDYKMVDSKNVISQVQDLQVDFKNYLKHKQKEMSVEDLVVRLCIEEDNRLAHKDTYTPDSAKANMIEHVGSYSRSNPKGKGKDKRKNDKKNKGKSKYLAPKAEIVNPRQANMMNDDVDMIAMVSDVCAKISESDEAIDKFVLYKTEVENQFGKKIKVVQSDRGGEYVSPFVELCAKHDIRHEFTAPYSPQQNGISERKNRTLKEMVTAMLISSGMSQDIAYRFIVHESKNPDIQKNAVMESRNASFFEHIFPCLSKETRSSSRLDDEVVQDKRQQDDNDLQDERQDQTKEEEIEPKRSKRARNKKSFRRDFVSFMVENKPTPYREAVTSLEGHQWEEAIKIEIDSFTKSYVEARGFTSWL